MALATVRACFEASVRSRALVEPAPKPLLELVEPAWKPPCARRHCSILLRSHCALEAISVILDFGGFEGFVRYIDGPGTRRAPGHAKTHCFLISYGGGKIGTRSYGGGEIQNTTDAFQQKTSLAQCTNMYIYYRSHFGSSHFAQVYW